MGAGYMGSAITFPLAENGLRVHLWGTWLDDDLLDGRVAETTPVWKNRFTPMCASSMPGS